MKWILEMMRQKLSNDYLSIKRCVKCCNDVGRRWLRSVAAACNEETLAVVDDIEETVSAQQQDLR